ncbi:hypothetical protein [Frisingicoccus sp.]|uniref:hypothetical protein n=1 Tax=Frisingicoccus sp. TaxID=1918627 RepID=UPI003AB5D828
MLDQNTFMETVREVSEIIRTASEPLSREEILGYFASMDLNETQKEMVLEYLLKPEKSSDSSKGNMDSDASEEEIIDEDLLEEGEGTLESEEISESMKSGGKNAESPKKGSQASELPDSPVFRMYLDEISGISLCTPEELQKLYGQLLEGNDSVIGKISENWMHRILEQVKKLSVAAEDFSDVVQEGNMALFMALSEMCGSDTAPADVEVMLDRAVEAAMKGYMDEITGEDDVENAVVGKVTLVNEARKYLMEQNGQEPSIRELAKYTKMSASELRDMLDFIQKAEESAKDRR